MAHPDFGPVKVTVSDPDTGEVLGEAVIENDYMVVCAGNRWVSNTQIAPNTGTTVITIRKTTPDNA